MSLENLKTVLPPPKNPFSTGNDSCFNEIEQTLGTQLPMDYKQFITIYGIGLIDEFIWVLNPFVLNDNLNLMEKTKDILEAYTESRNNFPGDFPYKTFPEQGGLLPWGLTENGDELYWLTEGSPEEWKVVIYGSRSSDFIVYPESMTSFLAKILEKKIVCELFLEEIPSEAVEFFPYAEE
ncbi:hypothetical protein J2S09_002310 [Bacillus fengqiuensis]|nr:hypothetical protein [Bacillus fengqiuensis]